MIAYEIMIIGSIISVTGFLFDKPQLKTSAFNLMKVLGFFVLLLGIAYGFGVGQF